MSTHWLDRPFLTQPRWEWWSDPLPVPQGFCFCRWKRSRRTRPGEEEESQPQGQICFSDLQNCNACICPWLAGLSLPKRRGRRHHGGWNAAATPLGRRKPKHTCDVLTNPQRPQVGDLSSLTSQRIWPGGDGDALRLQQRKLHLHAPVRLPEDCRPVIFWGLEKVEDMAFWRHLGSPRHLMYITRPFSSSIALWRICTFSISLLKRMPISKATRCRFRRSSRSRGRKIKGKGHCRLLSVALKAIRSVDQAKT